jgi:hypothetical protein
MDLAEKLKKWLQCRFVHHKSHPGRCGKKPEAKRLSYDTTLFWN